MYNNPFTDLKDAYCQHLISVSVRICGKMCNNNNVTNNVSETQNTVLQVVFVYSLHILVLLEA